MVTMTRELNNNQAPSTSRSANRRFIALTVILLVVVAFLGGYAAYLSFEVGEISRRMENLSNRISILSDQMSLLSDQISILANETQIETVEVPKYNVSLEPITIYERIKPSVVQIQVQKEVPTPFGPRVQTGEGSGFVYDLNGDIVTNNHVISDALSIRVIFHDSFTTEAYLLGADPYSDLAVIRVKGLKGYQLRPLTLGNSTELRVGETVLAVGNPFGLSGSLTVGVVSQKERILSAVGGYVIPDVIQVDVAINPGNSGGPLLTLDGRVVGITTAIASTTGTFSGVGFVIPSETVAREVPVLIASGYYGHPWIGISGVDLTYDIAKEIGLPEQTRGILITGLAEGGPAEEAGLRAGTTETEFQGRPIIVGGDVIVKVDGVSIKGSGDLRIYLERYKKPGENVVLSVIRDGEEISITLTLGELK